MLCGQPTSLRPDQLVTRVKQPRLRFLIYVSTQVQVLRAVLDVGVDAIVTNYPLIAMEAIDSRLAKCGDLSPGAARASPWARGRRSRPQEHEPAEDAGGHSAAAGRGDTGSKREQRGGTGRPGRAGGDYL
jgi:hypothetical protein